MRYLIPGHDGDRPGQTPDSFRVVSSCRDPLGPAGRRGSGPGPNGTKWAPGGARARESRDQMGTRRGPGPGSSRRPKKATWEITKKQCICEGMHFVVASARLQVLLRAPLRGRGSHRWRVDIAELEGGPASGHQSGCPNDRPDMRS